MEPLEQKLTDAEASLKTSNEKIGELEKTVNELNDKLAGIEKNPEHYKKVVEERDAVKKKLKEIEDKQAEQKGEFERLAKERLDEITKLSGEKDELTKKANEWDEFQKKRREALLAKITDAKQKKIAEALSLELLEEYVEINTSVLPDTGSGNKHPQQKDKERKYVIDYKT